MGATLCLQPWYNHSPPSSYFMNHWRNVRIDRSSLPAPTRLQAEQSAVRSRRTSSQIFVSYTLAVLASSLYCSREDVNTIQTVAGH